MMMDQNIYTCEYSRCPYNDYRLGFLDRNSRNNHQMNCPYQSSNSSQVFGMPNSQINDEKATVFSLRFAQPKPAYVSGLGLPEDGQKMISELMSFYDTNLQSDKSMSPGNLKAAEDHNQQQQQQQKFRLQMDDNNYYSQGVIMGGNNMSAAETNMSMHQTVLPTTEIQFDQPFDNNPTDNIVDFRFSSPFNLGSVDYAVDSLPKQDIPPLWYL
jgi:ethylene-insensitive protein 3